MPLRNWDKEEEEESSPALTSAENGAVIRDLALGLQQLQHWSWGRCQHPHMAEAITWGLPLCTSSCLAAPLSGMWLDQV